MLRPCAAPHGSIASRSVIPDSVPMPAVRRNHSNLDKTLSQANSRPNETIPAGALSCFLHGVPFPTDSTPRAYGLQIGNADLPISTTAGELSALAILAI
jgi:hypothetical protein